jgi:hypothetical protein
MKISKEGCILTLKNLGLFLASYTLAGIRTDTLAFAYALLIYAFISVPSDLFLMNHLSDKAAKEATAAAKETA